MVKTAKHNYGKSESELCLLKKISVFKLKHVLKKLTKKYYTLV